MVGRGSSNFTLTSLQFHFQTPLCFLLSPFALAIRSFSLEISIRSRTQSRSPTYRTSQTQPHNVKAISFKSHRPRCPEYALVVSECSPSRASTIIHRRLLQCHCCSCPPPVQIPLHHSCPAKGYPSRFRRSFPSQCPDKRRQGRACRAYRRGVPRAV